MTFAARENSRLNGRPFHLYAFTYGPEQTSVVYYTNLATEFTHGTDNLGNPIVYQPLPISHGEVVSSGNMDRTTLDVMIPESGIIPDLYRDETPASVVGLVIRQGHVGDSDMKIHWAGQVVGTSFTDGTMTLTCEPVSSSMRRSGLTRDWQITCPLVLYGSRCRANRTAATTSHVIVAVDGGVVTMPAGWADVDLRPHYLGGIFEWNMADGRKNRRAIVAVTETEIRLNAPAVGLSAGATVQVVLGCDKTMSTCQGVFDNILNYGGQPEIPLRNPVGITNNYY